MGETVAALLATFRRNLDHRFTPAEITALAAAAPGDLWAAKAVGLEAFRRGDLDAALGWMADIARRQPTSENLLNHAVCLRDLGRLDEAAALLEKHAASLAPIPREDLLCSVHAMAGRIEAARHHGSEALRLKDAAAPPPADPPPLVHRRFDLEARSRNVIAFSVWGREPRYLTGALNNAVVARYLYPGWTARFYVDGSTPAPFRAELARNAAEVVLVEDLPSNPWGLFWRFLVEDDPGVDFYLVRDADSVMNVKERSAVAGWLRSGRAFHVMRDHVEHSELILAGMWGAQRGNIGDMRGRVARWLAAQPPRGNHVHRDQHFLRQVIWPLVRRDVLAHDSHFTLGETARFDPDYALPSAYHIGQNDWVFYRKG